MEYVIVYEEYGTRVVTQQLREPTKNAVVQTLEQKGVKYSVQQRQDQIYHCAKIIFDIQQIEAAKKAFDQNKDIKGITYTFGDPNKVAKAGSLVEVQCINGKKIGYVVGIWKATFDQITEFKKQIGYKKLSCVIRTV